jgi:hypothetical protein
MQNPYESPTSAVAHGQPASDSPASTLRASTLVVMILVAAATRLIPPLAAPYANLWNFTAIGAMCLFGGAYFRRKSVAFLVPMVALFLSDLLLAATIYGFRSLNVVWMSYLLFGLTTLLGMTLRGRVTFFNVAAAAVVATAGFFLISNFHVWFSQNFYPHTAAGLAAAYIAAIPFAKNMLLGNLFYSAVLFGGYELLSSKWPALRQPAFAKATLQA